MALDTSQAKSWIQKTPDICGGDACIRQTRITVHGLVEWRQRGLSDQRLLEIIEGLTPEDSSLPGSTIVVIRPRSTKRSA